MDPILKNIAKEIGATRYNGGWTKSVTGINKSQSNGYSLLGEFIGDGLRPLQPGLYLDCDKDGSRKNVTHSYTLVELTPDGTVNTLATVQGVSGYDRGKSGHDWAVRLWVPIEDWQARQKAVTNTPLPNVAIYALEAMLRQEVMRRLEVEDAKATKAAQGTDLL